MLCLLIGSEAEAKSDAGPGGRPGGGERGGGGVDSALACWRSFLALALEMSAWAARALDSAERAAAPLKSCTPQKTACLAHKLRCFLRFFVTLHH